MRFLFVLLAASCWLSAVSAQWLETTLAVGDYPDALCYNSLNNKVYCACNGHTNDVVYVIDGATNAVLAEIPVSGFEGCGLCYNPAANKVYCSYWNEGYVTVICGAGDTVITDIAMQACRGYMACDPAGNRVYFLGDTGTVTVVDGAGDSILRVLHPGGDAPAVSIGYSPDHRKVFCGFDWAATTDTVFVIDCTVDSIITAVPVADWPSGQSYNPTNGRMYCRSDYDYIVTAIDCATNQAVAWIDLGYGQSSVCCAPPENKVFCTTYNGRFLVIDAGTNRVVDSLETGEFFYESFYNHINNKVYCASDSTVVVMDGATNQVLKNIRVGSYPRAFCHNPVQNRVYTANRNDSTVSVIRDSGGGVQETMNDERGTMNTGATIIRGVLLLPQRASPSSSTSRLLDISGRSVMTLRSGPNDVSRLSPGVYFVTERGSRRTVHARKLVVTR